MNVIDKLSAPLIDRRQCWDAIRAFADAWDHPLPEGVNAPSVVVPELPQLPAAVSEGYAVLAGRTELASCQDEVLPVQDLAVNSGYLVFAVENQSIWENGVLLDTGESDPMVYARNESVSDHAAEEGLQSHEGHWYGTGLRFSQFLLASVLIETGVHRRDEALGVPIPEKVDEAALEHAGFRPVGLPEFFRMGVHPGVPPERMETLWVSDLGVAYRQPSWEIWVTARDEATRQTLAEVLR